MSSSQNNPPRPLGEGERADANDIAIRVSNLSKCYQIYNVPRDRLKQFVLPRLRRLTGRAPKQYFREFWALKDVSFEIKKGETVGIIGRNGSGKSTLLQMICGTLNPTSGRIQINGRVAALLELGSGFNPEFTGRENVYMNASVLGLSNAETDIRFNDIVAFADIGDFIEQPVKTYSSGMMVRLAFAVIAHVDADVLVIDEALAVGDAFFVQKCMRFLHSFMVKGTVLFVSHDSGAIVNLCKRVVWLHKGNVEGIGLPKEITESYLQKLYEDQQGVSLISQETNNSGKPLRPYVLSRDIREDFINRTQLRNDIEIFKFSQNAPSFGKGGAQIIDVKITNEAEQILAWVVGGEKVNLHIQCKANEDIFSPIVGFMVKDRLGQTIFADNTYISYMDMQLTAKAGEEMHARFEFTMPVMSLGDYTITVAIAGGTQLDHIQHQWIHDALAFKVHATSVCHGLIGVPMTNIELKIEK
jgi:lipopolysaccharide transport system ATP-binding protein